MNKDPVSDSSAQELTPSKDEAVLADNLRTLTSVARGGSYLFSSLLFISPENDQRYESGDHRFTKGITYSLCGDCDDRNRAMLTKIYEMSHVDLEDAVTNIVKTEKPDGGELLSRTTTFRSPHGFSFNEIYHYETWGNKAIHDGPWEVFRVDVSPDESKQPDLGFLFGLDQS